MQLSDAMRDALRPYVPADDLDAAATAAIGVVRGLWVNPEWVTGVLGWAAASMVTRPYKRTISPLSYMYGLIGAAWTRMLDVGPPPK